MLAGGRARPDLGPYFHEPTILADVSEDMDLYARALIAGACFRTVATCHYVAVERAGSLSAAHDVGDLERFEGAVRRLLADAPPGSAVHHALRAHLAQTAFKRHHRALLARKREAGLWRALAEQADDPATLALLLAAVARDKLGDARRRIWPKPLAIEPELRFLL